MEKSELTKTIIKNIDLLEVNYGEYCFNIISRENGEELLKSANQLLSGYLADKAIDPTSGISGTFKWVEGLRNNISVCDLSKKAKDVRVDIHMAFYRFMDKLKASGYILNNAIHDPNVADAVFMIISMNIACDIMIELQDKKAQKKDIIQKHKSPDIKPSSKKYFNNMDNWKKVWGSILIMFLFQAFYEVGSNNPEDSVEYAHSIGRALGLIGICLIPSFGITLICRIFTGKWLNIIKFGYGVWGLFILWMMGNFNF